MTLEKKQPKPQGTRPGKLNGFAVKADIPTLSAVRGDEARTLLDQLGVAGNAASP